MPAKGSGATSTRARTRTLASGDPTSATGAACSARKGEGRVKCLAELDRVLPALAAHHRLTVPNLPGYGDTPPLDKPDPSVRDYADRIAAQKIGELVSQGVHYLLQPCYFAFGGY